MNILSRIRKLTGEPEDAFKKRKAAFAFYSALPLPLKDERWKFAVLEEIFPKKVSVGEQRIKINADTPLKERGVIWCYMMEAVKTHYPLLKRFLSCTLNDKFSAMCSSLWSNGVFIYVPKNISLGFPISNEYGEAKGVRVFRKSIVVVDENASAVFYEKHAKETRDIVCAEEIDVFCLQNSKIEYYWLGEIGGNAKNISHVNFRLEKGSELNAVIGNAGGSFSKVLANVTFAGRESKAGVSGAFFGKGDEKMDITTNATHVEEGCSCNILVKSILSGGSSSVYRGKIRIERSGHLAKSYLGNHTLLLGESSRANSMPSLEIGCHDVSASHGATMGKLDEEELFYAMARGLARKEAEKLIISGFFSDVLDNVREDIKGEFKSSLGVSLC